MTKCCCPTCLALYWIDLNKTCKLFLSENQETIQVSVAMVHISDGNLEHVAHV